MAGTPETIILDPAKTGLEKAEATQIKAKMLQDTIGSAGKNIMDIVSQYQDLKIQKQKQDLASMTTAGAMVGGMDNLPQESKNKLPGILGVPLPTNENGDVQVTPDLDTIIKRQTIDLLKNDPNAGRIILGLRAKEADPTEMANKVQLQKMRDASDAEKEAGTNARNQLDNDTRINQAIIAGQSREAAALTAGKSRAEAAKILAASKDKLESNPSPFVLDPKTNTLMNEPQYVSTYPGEQLPTKLSYRDAKVISGQQKADASIRANNSSVAANQARVKTLKFKLDTAMANPDPNDIVGKQIKHLSEVARLSHGTAAEPAMKKMVEDQMPDLLKQQGFDDNDLAAFKKMNGEGAWYSVLFNNAMSWAGMTSTNAAPSLQQPDTAHIQGVSPTVPTQQPASGTVQTSGNVISEPGAVRRFLGLK